MKKIIFTIAVLMVCFTVTSTAYAGSLNSYESEVVNAARGRFLYNGKEYELASAYINELTGYLSQDGVDLTKEQRDTVLQSMNAYIESGVKGGYLVPVDGQKGTAADPITSDNKTDKAAGGTTDKAAGGTTDKAAGSTTDKATGSTIDNTSGSTTDKAAGSTTDNASSNTSDKGSHSTTDRTSENTTDRISGSVTDYASGNTTDKASGNASGNDINPSNEEFMGGLLFDSSNADTKAASDNSDAQNTKDYSGTQDTPIIKNTGFNFNNTVITAIALGVLMLIGIIVTIKSDYFAHSDE